LKIQEEFLKLRKKFGNYEKNLEIEKKEVEENDLLAQID